MILSRFEALGLLPPNSTVFTAEINAAPDETVRPTHFSLEDIHHLANQHRFRLIRRQSDGQFS